MSNVIALDEKRILTPVGAQRAIHAIAQDSAKVVLTGHAKSRMQQRDITIDQVYRVLQFGSVSDKPIPEIKGGVSAKICMKLRSGKGVCVVTVIYIDEVLIIKTVI